MDMFELDTTEYLAADDTELEFSIGDFDLVDVDIERTRYVKPKFSKKAVKVQYNYARELAQDIKLYPGEQIHCLVGGNFIFGDIFEAILTEKNVVCKNMRVATLSLSQNNIDSFKNLLESGLVDNLSVAVSNYFFSHEKGTLIPYMLEELDIDDRFNLAVFRNHTKIVLMEVGNIRLVITGSANLRSSRSIEQFSIQESAELYDWYCEWFDKQMEDYSIIDKEVDK